MASLFLIPVTLSPNTENRVLPSFNTKVIREIKYFVVENIRSARRFLKSVDKSISIDELTFFELNKHTDPMIISSYLDPLLKGNNAIGLLSEAGCPAIADPGAELVNIAQKKGINIVPLVGPSSILMSLMASGFNGQNFRFRGYLPIEKSERTKVILEMEERARRHQETQIFIETPYRNLRLVEELIHTCKASTSLCIARDITGENEMIKTLPMAKWQDHINKITKTPTIFLIGSY